MITTIKTTLKRTVFQFFIEQKNYKNEGLLSVDV